MCAANYRATAATGHTDSTCNTTCNTTNTTACVACCANTVCGEAYRLVSAKPYRVSIVVPDGRPRHRSTRTSTTPTAPATAPSDSSCSVSPSRPDADPGRQRAVNTQTCTLRRTPQTAHQGLANPLRIDRVSQRWLLQPHASIPPHHYMVHTSVSSSIKHRAMKHRHRHNLHPHTHQHGTHLPSRAATTNATYSTSAASQKRQNASKNCSTTPSKRRRMDTPNSCPPSAVASVTHRPIVGCKNAAPSVAGHPRLPQATATASHGNQRSEATKIKQDLNRTSAWLASLKCTSAWKGDQVSAS